MRALSLLEAAGIPLMSSLRDHTGKIANILQIPFMSRPRSIESLLHDWLRPLSKATYPPTWNSLLQITRQLNLHDLAERAETCLKATTVNHQHKVTVAKEGKKIDKEFVVTCSYMWCVQEVGKR